MSDYKIVCANCDAEASQALLDSATQFVHEPNSGVIWMDVSCPHCKSQDFLLRKTVDEAGELLWPKETLSDA